MSNNDTIDYGKKLPICIHKYERGNIECDGRPRAKSMNDKIPCVYRDRCVAMQQLIKLKGMRVRELVKLRKIRDIDGKRRVYAFSSGDSKSFQRRLIHIIDRYGIKNGRITIRHPKEEKPKKQRKQIIRSEEAKQKSIKALKKARIAAARALKDKAERDMDATKEIFYWFLSRFEKKCKKRVYKNNTNVGVGDFFIIDKIKRSKYAKIYVKTTTVIKKHGKKTIGEIKKPIVCVVLTTRNHGIQFRTTLKPEQFDDILSKENIKKLGIVSFSEGKYKSKTSPVGKEGVSIFVDALNKAIKEGMIKFSHGKNCFP